MSVLFAANDWVDLRTATGSDLAALQNVAAGTMCCWAYPTTTGTATLLGLSIGSAGATNLSRLTLAKTGTQFQGGGRALDSDSNTLITTGSYSINTLYFVVMRVQFTTARGYLRVYTLSGLASENDTTLGNMTPGNTSNTASRSASIAAEEDGSSSFFVGRIWDARVYDRFLSDNECDIIFALRGRDSIVDGLKHRFPLDEGATGVAVGTAANILKDVARPPLTQQAAVDGPTWAAPAVERRRAS